MAKKIFKWSDYNFGTSDNLTKYNANDMKKTIDLEDDAAHVNWGGSWRMPTMDEFIGLVRSTNSTWVENYKGTGISGRSFADKKDSTKQIFFPAHGYAVDNLLREHYFEGRYWSNLLCYVSNRISNYMFFNKDYVTPNNAFFRYYGHSIRPVLDC